MQARRGKEARKQDGRKHKSKEAAISKEAGRKQRNKEAWK